ncbi:MAG: S8 family serine peptidase [Actinomycetota bacterium]|nr:S8 family serine peptidase [Actinomycetota bacterium]
MAVSRRALRYRRVAVFVVAVCAGAAVPATGLTARSTSTERVGVLVHAAPGDMPDALVVARRLGLRVGTTYPMIDVFVASGPRSIVERLVNESSVDDLEANARLEYHTDTSHEATRGSSVLKGAIELHGRRIDGRGIGVAVVDSGVDATHPDLADRMGGNVRIVCTRPGFLVGTLTECAGPKEVVELDNTDTGGHGTHVTGIVAGTGAASDGAYHGAAPGSTVYGVGMGTVLLAENALDGLRWVLDNHDDVRPRIRVVNNSWGSGYDPQNYGDPETRALTKMVELLVDEGVTVVFSAGNTGGDGTEARTSLECTIPKPGVICVANYDDGNSGTRDGPIRTTSSRGVLEDPSTWPDVSAPGTNITATCRRTYASCADAAAGDDYATLTGTSMAAPHVAGIAAQLLQVDPSLKPAALEDLLEDTAHELEWGAPYSRDPANRDDKSSFEKGHGLVDVLAAVRSLIR